jgi:hypothetical protein
MEVSSRLGGSGHVRSSVHALGRRAWARDRTSFRPLPVPRRVRLTVCSNFHDRTTRQCYITPTTMYTAESIIHSLEFRPWNFGVHAHLTATVTARSRHSLSALHSHHGPTAAEGDGHLIMQPLATLSQQSASPELVRCTRARRLLRLFARIPSSDWLPKGRACWLPEGTCEWARWLGRSPVVRRR